MEFEWDEAKNRLNRDKHGIAFEDAVTIFDGPVLTDLDDRQDDELREISFGLLRGVVVLCVVHTDRAGVMRIISARKATPRERERFHAHFR